MDSGDWLIDPGIAYLNHGGYGALPRPVADAAARWRGEVEANPTDLLARRWCGLVDDVRAQVATFLRGSADDLVFVANATTGTATAVASLELAPGDEIVTTDHRYPAVREQVTAQEARHGVSVSTVHVPLDVETADDVVSRVMAAVTPRTRLVVVDQIASATGFSFPVTELVAAAHAVAVPVLVDAAHAPGQLDIHLADIGADFWVGNLHKWVCSPRACAVMHVAPRWQSAVRPLVASWSYSEAFRRAFDWPGTLDPVPLLTIPDALRFWESLGWDDVRRSQRKLVTDGAHHVADSIGTTVPIADEFTAAMRLISLPMSLDVEKSAQLTAELTVEHGVTAYVTGHAGSSYVRVCGQLYNRESDYERLADALQITLRRRPG
jgi:isopenicillin-N epimerase